MTSIHALHEQALFEVEGTRRAVFRYREAVAHKQPHELPGGRRLLRDCVMPLAKAVVLGQKEAQGLLAGSAGRPPLWAWPMLLMDPEEIAVITVCTAMSTQAVATADHRATAINTCKAIAMVAQEQLGFNKWVEEQTKLNKQHKERDNASQKVPQAPDAPTSGEQDTEDGPRVDLLAALRARHPDVDRRTWASWRRKLEITKAEPWDKPTSLAFGGWLLEKLQETSDGRISIGHRPLSGGRTEAFVQLSPETEALLSDIDSRAEVARPLRLPMLCEPLPWDYLPIDTGKLNGNRTSPQAGGGAAPIPREE